MLKNLLGLAGVGVLVVAIGIFATTTRYRMQAVGGSGGLYVLDAWTGEIQFCSFGKCDPVGSIASDVQSMKQERNIFDQFDNAPHLERPDN